MIKFLDIQKNTAKYSGEIHQAIQKVVNSGWYLLGNEVKTFESHYADFIGTKYAIGVANGFRCFIVYFTSLYRNGSDARRR